MGRALIPPTLAGRVAGRRPVGWGCLRNRDLAPPARCTSPTPSLRADPPHEGEGSKRSIHQQQLAACSKGHDIDGLVNELLVSMDAIQNCFGLGGSM